MSNVFSPDSKIFQLINKLFYCAWLNVLWILCSLPIVTIGASTTALYYVTLKMAENEEGNVTQQFFHAFRQNLKKSTGIWMILLFVGILLGTDGYVLYHIYSDNIFWTLCTALLIGACVIYCIVILNIFPLFARFDHTIRGTFQNAFLMGIRYLFCSLLMAGVYFLIFYITVNLFTPLIIFGQGLAALLCSWLISPILKKLEENSSEVPHT